MKKIVYMALLTMFLTSGCKAVENNKEISIAVTGSPSAYSEYYKKGIKKAYDDVCEEYKDSGFDIKCEFYDDNDDYETAEKITAGLVNDDKITAIIASA